MYGESSGLGTLFFFAVLVVVLTAEVKDHLESESDPIEELKAKRVAG